MNLLRRIEKSLDHRLRSIFSAGREEPGAREAIELYRDALDQIAGRATIGKRGDRVFPFNLVTIELQAAGAERKAVLETLFDPGQLGDDVRSMLEAERVTPPPELTVAVRYPEEAAVEMRIVCERSDKPAPVPVPAATSRITPVPITPAPITPGAFDHHHRRIVGARTSARPPPSQPGTRAGCARHDGPDHPLQ